MWKTLLFVAALAGTSATTAIVSRTVYSGVGIALPVGAALKTTPDPANIWSWHETAVVPPNSTTTLDVLVDFDGNGQMDSEFPELRVLITDLQASLSTQRADDSEALPEVLLLDAGGMRWDLTPLPHAGAQFGLRGLVSSTHLATPLVLPVGSRLQVRITNAGTNNFTRTVRLNLIGRVVNL